MKDIKIAVHDGIFHADDVFAVAALKRIFDHVTVVRTRKPEVLATCDLNVDVGGKNDPNAIPGGYDHHQKGFDRKRDNGVPYASFGLIWRSFGSMVCNDVEIYRKVDEMLVQPVDALDSGYTLWPAGQVCVPFTVSHLISDMNPGWNEEQDFDCQFQKAVYLAGIVLDREIERARGVVMAKSLVEKAVAEAVDKRIVVLDKFLPWQEAVQLHSEVLFVVFPAPGGKQWNAQAVPTTLGGFDQKKSLPQAWAGLSGEKLAQVSGVAGAVFCHQGRFICGATTKEGAVALAKSACEV